ncbi:hypothetical protein NBC122_01078 [Chryseobacterium salivictor]|uniref:Uncharacterized protein n=1 Tax=Chryseobacterium salivictor TaxID=2547600 RepID=A0A4P6ZE93_9FLAO|nr:hypothetical protein NBC122_01078 [Chryseobacterium salivictor]
MSFGNIIMVRSEIEEAQSRRLCAAGVDGEIKVGMTGLIRNQISTRI